MTTTDAPGDTRSLEQILEDGRAAIAAAGDLDALAGAEAGLFGKRGALSRVKRGLGALDPEQRRTLGRQVNEAYAELGALLAERRAALEDDRDRVALAREAVDVTLPPRAPRRGTLHPVPETMDSIVDAFAGLGYRSVGGPEVESDWFNFTALNFPHDHPARYLNDTIYVRPLDEDAPPASLLLRTHTSPVQVRTLLASPPPVFVVVPGRVYRQDTPDATHLPVFHQVEGLAVAEGLSFADLRGTLAAFARALLGEGTRIRLRPHYFPFTEPSCEVDAWVGGPDGGFVELLGAGMVHPNVLRFAGHDPERVSGFAFGIGVERVAMLRYGIDDLRLLAENDLRFLAAF
jgi:phenylalanyl-tRNA synthetase alpha chain